METYNISDYLREYNQETKKGKCISCAYLVPWSREKLAGHKRSHCPDISTEEKNIFTKRKFPAISGSQSNTQDSFNSSELNDSVTDSATKEELDAAIANFFIRSGIAFRIADSMAWRKMISLLNPNYAITMPTSRTISGQLLDKQYEESSNKVNKILAETEGLILTSDGWTNIRNEHEVNFVVKAPNHPAIFYDAIDTSGIPQNAESISEAIFEVIEEIGPMKFSAVVTDNPKVMQKCWEIIELRYPWIAAYGCSAHGMNLVIKDIIEIPAHAKTIKEASKIIQFINNHHMASSKFEEKRKEANVTHKLSSPMPTRWYTHYNSAQNLLDAKVLLKRLAHEDTQELAAINPKATSINALDLMKSNNFWSRLEKLVNILQFPTNIIGKNQHTFVLKILFEFSVSIRKTRSR